MTLRASLGYITEVELLYQRTCTILTNIIAQLAPKEASIIVPTTAFLSLPTQDIIKIFNFTKWDFLNGTSLSFLIFTPDSKWI